VTTLFIVATVLVLYFTFAIFQISMASVCLGMGGCIEEVKVGMGSVICEFTVREIKYKLGLFPTGGYTKIWNRNEEDSFQRDGTPFEELSIISRMAIFLAGPISSLCIGLIFLVTAQSLQFSEVVRDRESDYTIRPSAVPQLSIRAQSATTGSQASLVLGNFMEHWWRLFAMQSLQGWGGVLGMIATCGGAGAISTGAWFTCLGAIIFSLGLFNLLPIPSLSGGRILLLAWEAYRGKLSVQALTYLFYVGMIPLTILWVRVIYADYLWFSK